MSLATQHEKTAIICIINILDVQMSENDRTKKNLFRGDFDNYLVSHHFVNQDFHPSKRKMRTRET
jgi:hypothetical protein